MCRDKTQFGYYFLQIEPQATIGTGTVKIAEVKKKVKQDIYLFKHSLDGLRHETQRIVECHERLMLGFAYVQPNLLDF